MIAQWTRSRRRSRSTPAASRRASTQTKTRRLHRTPLWRVPGEEGSGQVGCGGGLRASSLALLALGKSGSGSGPGVGPVYGMEVNGRRAAAPRGEKPREDCIGSGPERTTSAGVCRARVRVRRTRRFRGGRARAEGSTRESKRFRARRLRVRCPRASFRNGRYVCGGACSRWGLRARPPATRSKFESARGFCDSEVLEHNAFGDGLSDFEPRSRPGPGLAAYPPAPPPPPP